jgi:hypothetical protein
MLKAVETHPAVRRQLCQRSPPIEIREAYRCDESQRMTEMKNVASTTVGKVNL